MEAKKASEVNEYTSNDNKSILLDDCGFYGKRKRRILIWSEIQSKGNVIN